MKKPLRSTLAVAAGLLLASGMLLAAGQEVKPEIVAISLGGNMATFSPTTSGEAMTVSISCEGAYMQQEFAGAGSATMELRDSEGNGVRDGRCDWEARVHPFVDREALRAAEEAGDDAAMERLSQREADLTVIDGGTFYMAGGSAVAEEN